MTAMQPEQMIALFTTYYNSGDFDGLASLYEADAPLVADPAEGAVLGTAAIRDVYRGRVARKGRLSILGTTAIVSGEIALTHNRWRVAVPGGDSVEAVSAEMVRRQPDGTWRYAIDNPWGTRALGAGPDAPAS